MVRELITTNNEFIQPTFEADFDVQSICLAQDMKDTMRYNWSQGRIAKSLSSNQIGVKRRAIAVADKRGGKIEVMFNPQIVIKRGEQEFWEDNLFCPKKMFKVKRAYEIGIKFVAENGREKNIHCYGERAALIQQEIDNLDGILPSERQIMDVDVELKKPNAAYLKEGD